MSRWGDPADQGNSTAPGGTVGATSGAAPSEAPSASGTAADFPDDAGQTGFRHTGNIWSTPPPRNDNETQPVQYRYSWQE